MKIIYRISDAGYKKVKPEYANNKNCLKNASEVFKENCDWHVIADNVCPETRSMIETFQSNVDYVSIGHGAGTFNIALDKALKFDDEEIVYFLENDYLHLQNSQNAIIEGLTFADYTTLYDHPDKYGGHSGLHPAMNPLCYPACAPLYEKVAENTITSSKSKDFVSSWKFMPQFDQNGANPLCEGGAENTKVYCGPLSHWKLTNSTTMTFAAKVKTLKSDEGILREYTKGSHPNDFQMFLALGKKQRTLSSPIPSYSTHGEERFIARHIKWDEIFKN